MPATRKELILAIAVLAAIPVVAEVALRVARVPCDPQLYAPNRDRGWVLHPGVRGVVSIETPQYIQINSHGFRDEERSYDKAPDALRIAVLGNSWTEALQVPLEKAYTSVLQQKLAEGRCFGRKRIEVLNFGVAGYSTGQELLTLQQEVWKYRPDIVLLAFYPARDIANNLRELNNAVAPEQSPYFVFHGDKLILDDTFRMLPVLQDRQIALENTQYALAEHVRTVQAVLALQRNLRMRVAIAAVAEKAQQAGVDSLEYAIYAPPARPEMQRAWRVTEALFLAMRDEVDGHGAEFVIVTLATRPQVIPDPGKRADLIRRLGLKDLNYADKRVREFAARENIAVINLAAALAAHAETHHVYLNGFNKTNLGAGHWNETGHRLAGETIASELCRNHPTKSTAIQEAQP